MESTWNIHIHSFPGAQPTNQFFFCLSFPKEKWLSFVFIICSQLICKPVPSRLGPKNMSCFHSSFWSAYQRKPHFKLTCSPTPTKSYMSFCICNVYLPCDGFFKAGKHISSLFHTIHKVSGNNPNPPPKRFSPSTNKNTPNKMSGSSSNCFWPTRFSKTRLRHESLQRKSTSFHQKRLVSLSSSTTTALPMRPIVMRPTSSLLAKGNKVSSKQLQFISQI